MGDALERSPFRHSGNWFSELSDRSKMMIVVISDEHGQNRFFDVVGAPVISGRALTTADAEQGTRVVFVNEFFVKKVMGGRNPSAAGFASHILANPRGAAV